MSKVSLGIPHLSSIAFWEGAQALGRHWSLWMAIYRAMQ
jgi:hypothetical protein